MDPRGGEVATRRGKEDRQAEEAKKSKHISISCSFLQIYNEKVFDLLNTSKIKKSSGMPGKQDGLRIRWSKNEQF